MGTPKDIDGFLPLVTTNDTKRRLSVGQDLLNYLMDPSSSIQSNDIGQIIDGLLPWINSSNFKVSQLGLDIMCQFVNKMGSDFRAYIPTVISPIMDRLGDSKDMVRERCQLFLLKCMEKEAITPTHLFDRLNPCFTHKNTNVRDEVLNCLTSTLDEYGTSSFPVSKYVQSVIKLLNDPSPSVRDNALNTLATMYRHIGDRLKLDLQRKYTVPPAKLPAVIQKFDELRASGDLLPTAVILEPATKTSAPVERRPVRRGLQFDEPTTSAATDEPDKQILPVSATSALTTSGTKFKRAASVSPSVPLGSSVPRRSLTQPRQASAAGASSTAPTPLQSGHKFGRSGSIKRPSNISAGAVDEEFFIRSFEESTDLQLFSAREVEDHMNKIKDALGDSSEDWSKRCDAIKKVRYLILAGANNFDEFYSLLRLLEVPFQNTLRDLRSQVVREACITIAFLSKHLQSRFDHFAETILQPLMNLIMNSAKVVASAGLVTLRFILAHTHSSRFVPIILLNLSSKSKDIRRATCEFLDLILHSWSTHMIEKHVAIVQDAIKKGIADADSEARSLARKAFWGFKNHFPEQSESLLKSLDPSYKRALLNESGSLSSSNSSCSLNIQPLVRSTPRTHRQPSEGGSTSTSRRGQTPTTSLRSNSAIDLQAAQRAKARAQYAALARQKVGSGASLPRARKLVPDGGPGSLGSGPERVGRTRVRVSGVSQSQRPKFKRRLTRTNLITEIRTRITKAKLTVLQKTVNKPQAISRTPSLVITRSRLHLGPPKFNLRIRRPIKQLLRKDGTEEVDSSLSSRGFATSTPISICSPIKEIQLQPAKRKIVGKKSQIPVPCSKHLSASYWSKVVDVTGEKKESSIEKYPHTSIESSSGRTKKTKKVKPVAKGDFQESGDKLPESTQEIGNYQNQGVQCEILKDLGFELWVTKKSVRRRKHRKAVTLLRYPKKTAVLFLVPDSGTSSSGDQSPVQIARQCEISTFFTPEFFSGSLSESFSEDTTSRQQKENLTIEQKQSGGETQEERKQEELKLEAEYCRKKDSEKQKEDYLKRREIIQKEESELFKKDKKIEDSQKKKMVIESKDVGKCADDKELIELQLESEPKAGQFEHEFEKKRVGGEGNVRGKQKSVHKPKEKAHQKRGSLDSHEKEKKSPIEKRRVGHQAKEKEAQIGKVSYEIKELEQLEEEAVVKREKLNQHKKETVQERRKPGHDGYEKEITSSRRVPDDKHEVKTAKQSSHRVEEETVRQKEKVVHHKIKEVVCEEENLEKHKIKETIGESGKPRHHRYEQEAIQKRLKPALYKDVSVQARRELETFGEKYKEKEEASKRTHHRPTEKAKHEKGEPCPHKHQVEIVYERVRPTHHELEEKPVKGKKKSGSLDLKEKTKKSKSICHRCEKQIRSGKPSSHVYKETIRERKKHSSPKHEEVGKGRKSFQHKSEAEVVSEGTPEHEAKKQKSPCKRETPVQPQVREIPQIQFEGRIAQRRYIRIHGLIPPRVIIDEECDVLLKQLDSDNDNQFEVSTPDYLKVEEGQIRILGSEGSKEYVCGKVEHELKKVVEHDPDHSCIVESALLPPESEEESGSSISQHSNQWMSVQRTQSYLNLRATSKRHSRKAKAERLRLFYVSQSPKHTEHGRSSSTECHPSTSKQQGCGYHSRFEKGLEPTPSTSRQQLHSHHLHTPQLGPSTSQQQIHKYHSRSPEFHPLSSSRKIHRHQSHSPQNQRSLMLSKQRREYSVSPQHDSASSKKQRGYSCSPGPHLSTSREQDSKEQATHHSCSLEHSSSSPTWWKSKFFFPPSQYPGSKGKDEENEDKSESSGES